MSLGMIYNIIYTLNVLIEYVNNPHFISSDPTGKKLPSAKTSRIQIDPYPVGARCEVIPKARKEEPHPDEKLVSENAHLKRRISQQIKDRDTLLTENKDLLSMLVKSRDHIRTLEQERNWLTTKLEERTQSTSVRVTRKLRRVSKLLPVI